MTKRLLTITLAATILSAGPLAALALGTNEKGCLVGGAVGGLAGHTFSGNKTLIGAAVGCGAGVLINKQRVKKIDAKKEAEKKRQEAAARRRQYTQR
jgi:outer membrane lipoprotein SlyB